MTLKVRRKLRLRHRAGLVAGMVAVAVVAAASGAGQMSARAAVSGRVTVLEQNNRAADDVGQAVVWLETARPAPAPVETVSVLATDKEFRPRVVVVPVGSFVRFPNSDPFNHNVFSRSEVANFDLGLYGRGEAKGQEMTRAGIVPVYCNVHARMSAFVVVRDNPYYTQPAANGAFRISGVPPGSYTLKAWHERAKEIVEQPVRVGAGGVADLQLALDASGYQWREHLDKDGRPYSARRRRY